MSAITTEVTDIDWAELGREFAQITSTEQAWFLIGFYEAVDDAQLAHIGNERLFSRDRAEIANLIEDLAVFIRDGGK